MASDENWKKTKVEQYCTAARSKGKGREEEEIRLNGRQGGNEGTKKEMKERTTS